MGPSALDIVLASLAILLIPLGLVLVFTSSWWLAFIPLAIAGVLIVVGIFLFFRRAFNNAEERDNIL
jgi:hypothetical protein